jgi:chromosome segregation ATPase
MVRLGDDVEQVEDIISSITEQLADAQRDIDAEKTELRSYITERLSSDDKMLAALPNIVSKLSAERSSDEDEKSIEQWCKALISYRTSEIKAKVETTYLKSLAEPVSEELKTLSEDELKERKEELKMELDTLHSEIAAVNEMVVEREFRKPITEMIAREEREREQARGAWFEYVCFQSSVSPISLTESGLINPIIHDSAPPINR